MHRRPLRRLLESYAEAWPAERELAGRFVAFVDEHPDCLERSCVPGHVTASAWILDADHQRALLTHHRKLGKWLQLGGHVDGAADVLAACRREAQEESGMSRFTLWQGRAGARAPLDLDVHEIPARGCEPAHLHWDVRFLLVAGRDQPLVVSAESHDLAWVPIRELEQYTTEESVLRMHRKSREVMA
jgi:8-oxo-dGTP pyrophosphatase MutT (NUDIX family)